MSAKFLRILEDASIWMIVLITPLLSILWRRRASLDYISWKRFCLSICVGWLLLNIHRQLFSSAMNAVMAGANGDPHYDPVGGNAAVLVAGWIPLLISTLGVSLLVLLFGQIKRWRCPKMNNDKLRRKDCDNPMLSHVEPSIEEENDDQIDSRLPLWIALFANLINLLLTLPFFRLTANVQIRPMAWSFWIVITGICSAITVLPAVIFNLKRLRGRTWPKCAIILSLTPVPLALLVETLARTIIGYQLSP